MNFSTTTDGATGKTISIALPDLGGIGEDPTVTKAMKGYIALSRVKKVYDLLLVPAFAPGLFQQGPQPWPTLSLETLRGHVEEMHLVEAAKRTERGEVLEQQVEDTEKKHKSMAPTQRPTLGSIGVDLCYVLLR